MARRQGFFDDLMDIGSKLPWRVVVLSAGGAFTVLHVIAFETAPLVTGTTLAGLGQVVQRQLIHQFAAIFQYLLPAGLLTGAMVAFFKRSHSRALLIKVRASPTALASMNWRDFERLIGEAFRRRSFTVTGFGGNGPDGGVDLGLMRNGERFLVQCKHWKKHQVGVTVVRELNGVIAAQGAQGGYVVTGGRFTREAREFAGSCKIELIDGPSLEGFIGSVSASTPAPVAPVATVKTAIQSAPACPRCGAGMVKREATRGKFAGQHFWGCQQYPKCTGILKVS
jgi:restriction system protein